MKKKATINLAKSRKPVRVRKHKERLDRPGSKDAPKLTVAQAIEEMKAFGRGRSSLGVNLKELIEEGRD